MIKMTLKRKIWLLFIPLLVCLIIFSEYVIIAIDLLLFGTQTSNYTDPWTKGLMVWFGMVFIFFAIFALKILSVLFHFVKRLKWKTRGHP